MYKILYIARRDRDYNIIMLFNIIICEKKIKQHWKMWFISVSMFMLLKFLFAMDCCFVIIRSVPRMFILLKIKKKTVFYIYKEMYTEE